MYVLVGINALKKRDIGARTIGLRYQKSKYIIRLNGLVYFLACYHSNIVRGPDRYSFQRHFSKVGILSINRIGPTSSISNCSLILISYSRFGITTSGSLETRCRIGFWVVDDVHDSNKFCAVMKYPEKKTENRFEKVSQDLSQPLENIKISCDYCGRMLETF